MKKTIIVSFIIILAFIAGAFAQTTVALFPTIQVGAETRANAVWAVCYLSGYGIVDGEEVPGAWTDDAAMWAHYKNELVKMLKDKYKTAKYRESLTPIPAPESYDIGTVE